MAGYALEDLGARGEGRDPTITAMARTALSFRIGRFFSRR